MSITCVSTIADGFSELLQNARRADATRVRVTLVGSGGDLAVSVTDDGPGIADPGVLLPALEAGRPLDATRCAPLRPAPLGRCGRRLGLEGRLGGGRRADRAPLRIRHAPAGRGARGGLLANARRGRGAGAVAQA